MYHNFIQFPYDDPFVRKIQKHLAVPIKRHFYLDFTLQRLSFMAAKQKILLSFKQVSDILQTLSDSPFIWSSTFIKVLTNAMCTTSRIKNHPTLCCFACGKGRDDLFHFLRCPHVAFIFNLPPPLLVIYIPLTFLLLTLLVCLFILNLIILS